MGCKTHNIKSMKKLLLIITLLAALPSFAQDFKYFGIWYTIIDEGEKTCMTKAGSNGKNPGNDISGDIILPEKVEYHGVSYQIIYISPYTFCGCFNLTSVKIPNSVTSIGKSAFSRCSGLTSVNIGNSVTSIGEDAFYGCSGLSSVTIGNSVTLIGDGAFCGCSSLTSVTIPNSVTKIDNDAFSGCSAIKEITFEDGDETLSLGYRPDEWYGYHKGLFYGCPLEKLYLGRNLSYLNNHGYSPFYDNSRLKEIIIGKSVRSIGQNTFSNFTALKEVTFEDGDKTLSFDYSLFSNCPIEKLYLGRNLSKAGSSSEVSPFANKTKLVELTIGNTVTSIGEQAFNGCSALTSATIGNSVTSIGDQAFNGCSALTSVNITDIASWCKISFGDRYANPLYYAHNLYLNGEKVEKLIIPESVTSIKDYAFYGCSDLTSVTIPNSVTSIGNDAFYGCI